jgi:hypothetical protein
MRPPRPTPARLLAASATGLAAACLPPGVALAATGGGTSLDEEQWRVVRVAVIVLAAVVVASVAGGFVIERIRWRRARHRAQFQEVRALSEEDIGALGADLAALDTTVQVLDGDDWDAMADLRRAHEWFEQAHERIARAGGPSELAGVSSALEAARFYMTSARSQVEGHGALERLPPCFFDTRHGPSVNDVGWMPVGAAARPVPACAMCMSQVNDNVQPPVRLIRAGGELIPFYNAPPQFESWFGGYFGGTAQSLVQGFPLGQALDDGFAGSRNMGIGHGYVPASFADTGELDEAGGRTGFREGEDSGIPPTIDLSEGDDASLLRRSWRQGRARASGRAAAREPSRDGADEE